MKEVVFINKNKARWKTFENFLRGEANFSPDELADYYIQLTDDLSYAKTFYPDSNLIIYLNDLAAKVHQIVYRNKKEEQNRIFRFFSKEVPLAIWKNRRTINWALFIFILAIVIGLFSTFLDNSFTRQILGDSYVNMTIDNIQKGDPMAVYKSEGLSMMLMIGSNNIKVALYAYVFGIFGTVITAFILLSNGIMVGAFLHLFVSQKLFWIAFSTIFIHGALELTAIVIAGGAGMVLGNSFLFPGTYSRLESLKRGAKSSLKIMIGLIPVIVSAAILESFVTKHYLEIGSMGRWLIIIGSFIFVFWYFIYLPRKLYSNG